MCGNNNNNNNNNNKWVWEREGRINCSMVTYQGSTRFGTTLRFTGPSCGGGLSAVNAVSTQPNMLRWFPIMFIELDGSDFLLKILYYLYPTPSRSKLIVTLIIL